MNHQELHQFLDEKVDYFNRPSFIEHDPICIPHRFSAKQDIEISGLFAALFAWGNRTTIINKATDLMNRMGHTPYDFIKHHKPTDLKSIVGFKHRTFTDTDILFLIEFMHQHYQKFDSLENAFFINDEPAKTVKDKTMHQKNKLHNFYTYVFSHEHLKRTEKHISSPAKNSACKRINMYLRWMVRQDNRGVDFGIWQQMSASELMIPLDVHVCRVAHSLGLMDNEKSNWRETVSLTEKLRQFDSKDPVKYDFALFGMGVDSKKSSDLV